MFPDVSLDDGQIARVLLPVWSQLVVRSVAVYRQSRRLRIVNTGPSNEGFNEGSRGEGLYQGLLLVDSAY